MTKSLKENVLICWYSNYKDSVDELTSKSRGGQINVGHIKGYCFLESFTLNNRTKWRKIGFFRCYGVFCYSVYRFPQVSTYIFTCSNLILEVIQIRKRILSCTLDLDFDEKVLCTWLETLYLTLTFGFLILAFAFE